MSPVAPANSPVPPVIASTEFAGVEERPLDGDLALVQGERPEALPGLADQRAEANALVRAHLVLVVGIVHLVGEGEDVAGGVALIPGVGDGVGIGVFHHFDFLRLRHRGLTCRKDPGGGDAEQAQTGQQI